MDDLIFQDGFIDIKECLFMDPLDLIRCVFHGNAEMRDYSILLEGLAKLITL